VTVKTQAKNPLCSLLLNLQNLWEARVYEDGKKIETVKSVPLCSVINGFWINETGNLEIIYQIRNPRMVQDRFSNLTTFIGCIGYLFYDWRRENEVAGL